MASCVPPTPPPPYAPSLVKCAKATTGAEGPCARSDTSTGSVELKSITAVYGTATSRSTSAGSSSPLSSLSGASGHNSPPPSSSDGRALSPSSPPLFTKLEDTMSPTMEVKALLGIGPPLSCAWPHRTYSRGADDFPPASPPLDHKEKGILPPPSPPPGWHHRAAADETVAPAGLGLPPGLGQFRPPPGLEDQFMKNLGPLPPAQVWGPPMAPPPMPPMPQTMPPSMPPRFAPPTMPPMPDNQRFLNGPPDTLACDDDQEAASIPLSEQGTESTGSKGHAEGNCKPCIFMHKRGCERGTSCPFCHLCDVGEVARRRKAKRTARNTAY